MTFIASVSAASLVVGAVVAPLPVSTMETAAAIATTAVTTVADDADQDAWTYSVGWTQHAGETIATAAGTNATLTFTGTSVELVGAVGPASGRARVWVDCGEPIVLDMYAPTIVSAQSVAMFDGLPAGVHTLVVEVLGTHDKRSTDSVTTIDLARVTNDPTLADPRNRWQGTADGNVTDPVELRRAGCGSQSNLISQLKLRSSGGWFDAGESWGAVNGHSAALANGRAAPGPVVIADAVREAATLGMSGGKPAELPIDLVDASRSLVLWVSADSSLGAPVEVAIASRDSGAFLPTHVLTGGPQAWTSDSTSSSAVTVQPSQQVVLVVDLTTAQAGATEDEVLLWSSAVDRSPAELVIIHGTASDLTAERLAAQITGSQGQPDAAHLSAGASEFARGPVVLTRVLADVAQPAWTGDQTTSADDFFSRPVDLEFGQPLAVAGRRLPAESMSLTLPPATWPNTTSSVVIRLETDQRCRSLTASVGIDDRTPSRAGSSISVGVFGDGERLGMKHNGIWASVDTPGASRSPVTDGEIREELASELRAAKLAALSSSGDMAAITALINAQAEALAATSSNDSMAVTSYPVQSPLMLGAIYRGDRPDASFAPANLPSLDLDGTLRREVPATGLDPFALYPLSVDLMTDRKRDLIRTEASRSLVGAGQLQSPLVRLVDLVISGTPGTIVDVANAGLDCVDAQTGPARVMPLWSQLGVAPQFLPTPSAADGSHNWQLGSHPLWWDLACPAGPTIDGLRYTATKTRLTTWMSSTPSLDPGSIDTVRVDEVATASLPACGLPADQRQSAFSDFAPKEGSASHPDPETYYQAFRHVSDPTADRVRKVTGDWTDELKIWAADAAYETLDDPVTFALWAALAPFDIPAAIVLNPFTQHALPLSSQLALGSAFLHFGVGELVAAIPAASTGAGELRMMTTDAATADAAAGRSALLTMGDNQVAIPLVDGEYGPTADLALEQRAARVVTTDAQTAGIPSSRAAPGWVDDALGEATMCPRGGGGCQPKGRFAEYPTGRDAPPEDPAPLFPDDEEDELPDGDSDDEWIPPGEPPQPEAHIGQDPTNPPVGGFWERYPDDPSMSVVGESADWLTSTSDRVREAWFMTFSTAEHAAGVDASKIALQIEGGERLSTLAIRTSREPLYVYSTKPPGIVMGTYDNPGVGLQADGNALSNFYGGYGDEANLLHAIGPDRDRSMFVLASPDPYQLSMPLAGADAVKGYFRYEISLAGGFNVRQSLAQAGVPEAYRLLSNDPGVLGRAPVAFPGGVPPADIVGWDKFQTFPGTQRFEVVASNDDLFPVGDPRLSFAGSSTHDWAVYDWYDPRVAGAFRAVTDPPSNIITEYRQSGGFIIFEKQVGWSYYDETEGLTPDFLSDSGFSRGTWEGAEDVEVWVPRSTDSYTVHLPSSWHPSG